MIGRVIGGILLIRLVGLFSLFVTDYFLISIYIYILPFFMAKHFTIWNH